MLSKQENKLVKILDGKLIITMNDFESFLGIKIKNSNSKNYFFREEYFTPILDWNELGQGKLREEFEKENNVHYTKETFIYLRHLGVIKALNILLFNEDIDIQVFRYARDYIHKSFKELIKEQKRVVLKIKKSNSKK